MTDIGTPATTVEQSDADRAVAYTLRRISNDPRLAYFMGGTEALRLLTTAHAKATGADPDEFHRSYSRELLTERPTCSACRNGT